MPHRQSRIGFDVAMTPPVPVKAPDGRQRNDPTFGRVVQDAGGLLLGLRPIDAGADRLDPHRISLDHLSLAVATRADLDPGAAALGMQREDLFDMGPDLGMVILWFRNPDGNALQLTTPQGS